MTLCAVTEFSICLLVPKLTAVPYLTVVFEATFVVQLIDVVWFVVLCCTFVEIVTLLLVVNEYEGVLLVLHPTELHEVKL